MYYDKIIRYLEYLENGEKVRSAGFVKIEVTDQVCNVLVNVTGLHSLESCSREVRLRAVNSAEAAESASAKEGILGTILLRDGKGTLVKKRLPIDRLCEGIGYHDLAAVRINLGKGQELVCRFREEPEVEQDLLELPQQPPMIPDVEKTVEMSNSAPVSQMPVAETPVAETLVIEMAAIDTAAPQHVSTMVIPVQQEPEKGQLQPQMNLPKQSYVPSPVIPPILHENKWKQLSQIYPHIAPFRDERDYLSIGPGDFVVLPQKYYGLVNNSFLIHGFYNYGHMVLARTMKRGEEKFYLGVPGNFYEKERQVAIMFGFESFECRREPAQDGDFGYFMIRVEL